LGGFGSQKNKFLRVIYIRNKMGYILQIENGNARTEI
jgi:hypothetical protein